MNVYVKRVERRLTMCDKRFLFEKLSFDYSYYKARFDCPFPCQKCRFRYLSKPDCIAAVQATVLFYSGYRKTGKKICEFPIANKSVTFQRCDDMVDAIEYSKEHIQKSLENMILPKDFKTRFNYEMTVVSTDELPNDLKEKKDE